MLFTSNSDEAIAQVNFYLYSRFHIKDLRRAKFFLEIEIARSESDICFSQCKYALELMFEVVLSRTRP